MDIESAAGYTTLSVSYLQELTSQRRVPFARIGRRCLFDRVALNKWIARRAVLPRDAVFPSGVENAK